MTSQPGSQAGVAAAAQPPVLRVSGRKAEAGPTDAILRAPVHDYTQRLLASVPCPGWQPRPPVNPPLVSALGRHAQELLLEWRGRHR